MAPVGAFFLPILAALALSGCMHTASPVALAPGDLDAMAYGQPNGQPVSAPASVADTSGGGAISALRNAMSNSSRPVYAEAPEPAPAVAPMPAASSGSSSTDRKA